MINKFAAALLSVSLLGAWSAQAQAPGAGDPYALFAQYVQAVNAGDKVALHNLISDDVERPAYWGCTPQMSNRDCLLAYVVNTVIDRHGTLKETSIFAVDGDTLYGGLELRSDAIHAAGSGRVMGIDKIKVKDNKIMSLAFLPNLHDEQTKKFFDHIRAAGIPSSPPNMNQPGANRPDAR